MSYRLTMSQTPGDGLRRCAFEQLQEARDGLTEATAIGRADAVHEARKSLKKTRSLLRLARPVIGGKRYRVANAALRDTGRTLSGSRDADVLVQVVSSLHERYVGRLPASAFDGLRSKVDQAARPAARADDEDPVALAVAQLSAIQDEVAGWNVGGATWTTMIASLARTYARGRAEMELVAADPSLDARHDWRKRVKDLWYQQRLIAEAWEPVLAGEAEQAHLLSELLGDDHDLAVLHEAIATGQVDAGADAVAILALIDDRRDELLSDALLLARRVYAESPKAFTRRRRTYVEVWADTQKIASAGI